MLFKVVRENETTYYIPEHIRKITISPVYGSDDSFDVAFYVDDTDEIVKVFPSFEEAEKFVQEIYAKMISGESTEICDLNKF
jgi:hypothetical protein